MSIVASFASVPTVLPYLMLPHLFLSVISLITAIVLVGFTVSYTFRGILSMNSTWPINAMNSSPREINIAQIKVLQFKAEMIQAIECINSKTKSFPILHL